MSLCRKTCFWIPTGSRRSTSQTSVKMAAPAHKSIWMWVSRVSHWLIPCTVSYLCSYTSIQPYNYITLFLLSWAQLIHRCWSFVPASRPTFDYLKKALYRINPIKESPVDMMMIMVSSGRGYIVRYRSLTQHCHNTHLQMEKYSKHLEVMVAERTQELIAEQQKTANLLYSEQQQHISCMFLPLSSFPCLRYLRSGNFRC